MFVVLCFITCLAPRLVKGQMTVNKEYSFPSSLPLPLLSVPLVSVPLLPAALPPPGEARLPGHGAVGLAGSTLRLITPLILGLPVCLQGKNSGLNPPLSAPTPTLPLSLYLFSTSSSIPFIPLSLCCQRHWGTTLSHSFRQGHSLVLTALFVICHGKWGSRGLCHGLTVKKRKRQGGLEDEGWKLHELGNRLEQKMPVQLRLKDH